MLHRVRRRQLICAGRFVSFAIGNPKIGNRKSPRGCSPMAERQLPKLHTGVRFPSPAHLPMRTLYMATCKIAFSSYIFITCSLLSPGYRPRRVQDDYVSAGPSRPTARGRVLAAAGLTGQGQWCPQTDSASLKCPTIRHNSPMTPLLSASPQMSNPR